MRAVWRQGYHYQIHGQSIHVADKAQKWGVKPVFCAEEFGDRWGAYDDDSGILLVTAPTVDRCVELCERYIRRYRRLFASKTYVAMCSLFMAVRKMEDGA